MGVDPTVVYKKVFDTVEVYMSPSQLFFGVKPNIGTSLKGFLKND